MLILYRRYVMKVFIYDNKEKDVSGECLHNLINELELVGIQYQILEDCDLVANMSADAIFALGGDGTILWLIEFANRNQIPIIGINVGKLGFLSEFERNEIKDAVTLLNEGKLKIDERLTLKVIVDNGEYHALNDAYVQRTYSKDLGCLTTDVNVVIDGFFVGRLKGDGVVVCSPTGSTAYSLSAGGPILSPNVNALCVTPISAHGLGHKPIVFSSDSQCVFELVGKTPASLFVDGRHLLEIKQGDVVRIEKAKSNTKFLRKPEFNFFKRLTVKLKDNLNLE